ncbi:MAG: DUF262 domain-containing protein [Selenomonadaceae bacterium]|nr:DUF262 domain-containing protein [Selenomonadaceae bacterium]
MAKDIDCVKKILEKVFDSRYRIPDYQRPYVWENEHVEALLTDTLEAYKENKNSQYFLGAIVLKVISEDEFEILDGQQRLTTIFLILAVIRDISDDEKLVKKCREAVFQAEDKFSEKPECLRIEFDIRDDVRDFVDKYVKADGATRNLEEIETIAKDKTADISVRNMAAAIITIKNFFQEEKLNKLGEYFIYLWKKIVLICIWTEEFDDAFQLFTVLNNRGVKLNNSDLLKAINLREFKRADDRRRYAQKWQAMEKGLGDYFDQFLTHVFAILVKRKAKATLLKEFEEDIYSKKRLSKGRSTFDFIDGLFEIYKKTFVGVINDKKEKYTATNYLRLMTAGLNTDYWKAAVLLFYKKNPRSDRFGEFMKLLDKKISADWICGLSSAKRIENFCSILREIDSTRSLDKLFKSNVFKIDLSEIRDILNRAVNSEKRSGYAKYLLLKLDMLYNGINTEFSVPNEISIEHILPQSPPKKQSMAKEFFGRRM